jgi:sugar phosphate isomerase/epimerase
VLHHLNRREFVSVALAAGSAAIVQPSSVLAAEQPGKHETCAFIKFIQTLSYDQLANTIAEIGYDGIEATVRAKGYVPPERVEDELPKLVEALNKRNLRITVMTTDVNRVDQPLTAKVLKTAAAVGVKRYRMGAYRYDLGQPVESQLAELKPVLADLAAMNRELGLQGVYQNHSGATNVGAPVWDIYSLVKHHPVDELGIAFDIRHATVEGGLAWPIHFNLVRPHLGIVYFKDFTWHGRRAENVPLGAGQVDPKFVTQLQKSGYNGPISVHVEYLEQAGVRENVEALKNDLTTLRTWLAS